MLAFNGGSIMTVTSSNYDRIDNDFYETEPWTVEVFSVQYPFASTDYLRGSEPVEPKVHVGNKIAPQNKTILDPCCGARMFWFDKNDERAVFGDIRKETKQLCDGRTFKVQPDQIMDFCNLPYADNCFDLVVFDPPHLIKVGINSWMASKYGRLDEQTWRDVIRAGFSEGFRVLKPGHTLVFKWAEKDIAVSEILKLTPVRPVIGHKSGKQMGTHWILFLKDGDAA